MITSMSKLTRRRRQALQISIVALSVAILAPQLGSLSESLSSTGKLRLEWLFWAGLAISLSYVFAGLVYVLLVPRRLPFARTLAVQLATGFTNRVVPSGIGALGLNTLYLARQLRISKTAAISYATANNFVGFMAFVLTVGVIGIFSGLDVGRVAGAQTSAAQTLLIITAMVAGLGAVVLVAHAGGCVIKLWRTAGRVAGSILGRPLRLLGALAMSIGITLCNIFGLYACVVATGNSLPMAELLLVFSAGLLAIAVSPTPNGLGAAELTMSLALGLTGQPAAEALSIVLAYRLVTFWLPILPGYLMFRYVTGKRFV